MFQEPMNTPFFLNWLMLAFLALAIKISNWDKQLILCKTGFQGLSQHQSLRFPHRSAAYMEFDLKNSDLEQMLLP